MKKRMKLMGIIVAALIVFLMNLPGEKTTDGVLPDGTATVHFIDVGQADASLLMLPDGKTMLIDAGNNDDGALVVEYLQQYGIKTIDILIGTHPHEDHIGGLDDVIRHFDIGEIYMPKVQTNTKTFRDVLTAVKEKGLTVKTAKAGITLFEENGAVARMVAPNGSEYESLNNYSAVVHLSVGDTAFLFMGDAEVESEEEIKAEVSADVLKIGHHGSSTSTSESFFRRVSPEYVFIPCGEDNSYGHPHKEIRELLKDYGTKTYRADTDGTVVFASDGKKVWVVE